MTRTHLTAIFVVSLATATGYGLYVDHDASQRHAPPSAPRTAQPRPAPAQPPAHDAGPPPQAAQPRESPPPADQHTQPEGGGGHKQPPGAPTVGRAEPRAPSGPRPHPPVHGGWQYPGPWYGWYGYPWYPWGYPWGYPAWPETTVADWMTSNIKLEVTPKEASVYVDSYYAGLVDNFDGIFQSLTLPVGPHVIEVRKEHYRSLVLEVNLQPGQTIHYKRTMEPSAPDEALPETPSAALGPIAADPEQFIQIPGSVRLEITPRDAEVYADGYYAGIADDFSGSSQRLVLTPGDHHIELRARGYETMALDVMVQSGQTLEYRTALQRAK